MEAGSSVFSVAPPVFDGENYQAWAVRVQAYLEGCDFWEAVEQDYEVAPLPDNPTINQIKFHKERTTRKAKAKSCLYAFVSLAIFSEIMAFESAKAIWDFLKVEYQGDERIRSMKGLNLITEFERLRMKESGTIKEYSDKLISIANQARVLGTDLSDNRLVQKILVSLPERFEATIASLENTKDLSRIKLAELLSALQAQEQRRLMRPEGKKGDQQQGEAHAAAQQEVDQLFVASRFSSSTPCESWLVDSGCTNHMTSDEKLFIDLDKSLKSGVRIGNGEYLEVKGKGIVAIESCLGTKLVSDVMYVPEIDQNLLSVGQLVEKGFKVKRDKLGEKAEPGIFVGYDLVSKAYGIYQRQTGKIITSGDVHFLENEQWDRTDESQGKHKEVSLEPDEPVDDVPVRGTGSLSDIYQRCSVAVLEPASYEEAKSDQKWMNAMKEELTMIEKNRTWELVERPQDGKVIGVKWVFRTKLNPDGLVNKHKARLVVKGYVQVWGVDFSETFAPVARLDTIRMTLALAAQQGWKVY
ncbi:uncharacterized protein LOC125316165 [Rhodamnia argentea]|uniref:Uncharacterized protein LOC125316165 n=1 Tax=Rhodamnia argentea TaxID=178133 RepID=A0ABM3HSN5_9MYRT|nr:uncharacterized protein LOC125316165 [Rhodamnia argentea]